MIRILSLLLIAALVACSPKDPSDPKFVVAKVNGEKIYRAELDESLEIFLKSRGSQRGQLPEGLVAQVEQQILNQIVDGRLVVAEVNQTKSEQLQERCAEEFIKFKERFPDEEKYQEMLDKLGSNEESLKTQIEQSVALDLLMQEARSVSAEVTDEKAKAFYDGNPQYWQRPETVKARHILVRSDKDASSEQAAASKKKIDDARKRIAGGEDFAVVASEISDDPGSKQQGGTLPPFPRGRMVPEFDKVAFSSPQGKLSKVFKTDFGFHFLEVLEKKAAETVGFEKVVSQIKKNLQSMEAGNSVKKQVDEIRSAAKIEKFLPEPEKNEAQIVPKTAPSVDPS
ncbi:MAG: peptidylprolyl isomerase [Verrucomicrobiota bacterium]